MGTTLHILDVLKTMVNETYPKGPNRMDSLNLLVMKLASNIRTLLYRIMDGVFAVMHMEPKLNMSKFPIVNVVDKMVWEHPIKTQYTKPALLQV